MTNTRTLTPFQVTDDVLVPFTLTLDTLIYASGDVLAATQEITGVMARNGRSGKLLGVVLNDKDDQGIEMDLVFLKTNVSIGAENAAASAADADSSQILGIVNLPAAKYVDMTGNKVATLLLDNPLPLFPAATSKSIWLAAITRGTPTHTAAGITGNLIIRRD